MYLINIKWVYEMPARIKRHMVYLKSSSLTHVVFESGFGVSIVVVRVTIKHIGPNDFWFSGRYEESHNCAFRKSKHYIDYLDKIDVML